MPPKVADLRAWKLLNRRLEELAGSSYVKVGVLASEGGSAEAEGGGITLIELATIHELGTAEIPARSFIRSTLVEQQEAVGKLTGALTKAVIEDRIAPPRALDILGVQAVGLIKKRVMRGPHLTPALAPSTIERKGSSRPLVDHGVMINAVSHQVVS